MTRESSFAQTAGTLREALYEIMTDAGFPADFTQNALSGRERLFDALAHTDLATLFDGADTPRHYRMSLPEAFEGLSPEQSAETLSLLHFLRRYLRAAGTGRGIAPPRRGGDPADAAAPIPLPNRGALRMTLEAIRREPFYGERERKRAALFAPETDGSPGVVEERLAFLESAFGIPAGLADPRQLAAADARTLTEGCDPYAPTRLMDVLWPETPPPEGGHLTITYCACLSPRDYPVSNRYTDTGLLALRRHCGFYPFLPRDLCCGENYAALLGILRRACRAADLSNGDLSLWLEYGGRKLKNKTERTNRKEKEQP